MNHREPPALATWLLHNLTSRVSNDALSGDLLEAFHTGRSAGWYWYQVIAAIAIAWWRNAWDRRAKLAFAAVWSLLSPACRLLNIRLTESRVYGHVWLIPWPWSSVCDLLLRFTVPPILFMGLGVAVYSTLHLLEIGKSPLRLVWKGFFCGLVAYSLAWLCVIAIVFLSPQAAMQIAIHERNLWLSRTSLTLLGAIENFGTWNELLCLPYFIGTATTLWFFALGDKREQVRIG